MSTENETFDINALAQMSDDDFLSGDFEDTIPENVDAAQETDEELEVESEDVNTEEQSTEELDNSENEEYNTEEDNTDDDDDDISDEVSELNTDSEKLLEKLFSPFNANGTQIKVDSVEEAIQLMQMGANYHKKMHNLKPYMRFIKALESKQLLNDDKMNHVIDLMSGDKKALAKLLADANIDPLDVQTDESTEYSPVKHVESESTANLNEVLAEVQHLPAFKDTMDIVTTQWDSSSKEELGKHPERIKVLIAHKENGTFDLITAEVARMRLFGMIGDTVSDIQAYEQAGIALMSKQGKQSDKPETVTKPTMTDANDDLKKRIAQPRSKKPQTKPVNKTTIEDWASLSDEEFLKVSSKYV